MITKINLKGFLTFKNERTIEFSEYANVINGPTKSGKSAIIEAIYFILSKKYEDKRKIVQLKNHNQNIDECYVRIYFALNEEVTINFKTYKKFSVTRYLSDEKCDLVHLGTGRATTEQHIADFYCDLIDAKLFVLPEPNIERFFSISDVDLKSFWIDGTHAVRVKEMVDDFNAEKYRAKRDRIKRSESCLQKTKEPIEDVEMRLEFRDAIDQALAKKRLQQLHEKYQQQRQLLNTEIVNEMNKKNQYKKTIKNLNDSLNRKKQFLDHLHQKRVELFEQRCGQNQNNCDWKSIIHRSNQFLDEIKVFEDNLEPIRRVFNLKHTEKTDIRIYLECQKVDEFLALGGAEFRRRYLETYRKYIPRQNNNLRDSNRATIELEGKSVTHERAIRTLLDETDKECEKWCDKITSAQEEAKTLLFKIREKESQLINLMCENGPIRNALICFFNVEQNFFKPSLSNGIQLVYSLLSNSDPKYLIDLIGQVMDFIEPAECEQYQDIFDVLSLGISAELSTFVFKTQRIAESFVQLVAKEIKEIEESIEKMNEERFAAFGISTSEAEKAAHVWDDLRAKVPKFTCKIDSYERICSQKSSKSARTPKLLKTDILNKYPRMNNIFDKYLIVNRVPGTVGDTDKVLICTEDNRVHTKYGILMQSENNNRYEKFLAYLNSNQIELRDRFFNFGHRLKQSIAQHKELNLRFAQAEAMERNAKKWLIDVLIPKVGSLNNRMQLLSNIKIAIHREKIRNHDIREELYHTATMMKKAEQPEVPVAYRTDITTTMASGSQVPEVVQLPPEPETLLPLLLSNDNTFKDVLNGAQIDLTEFTLRTQALNFVEIPAVRQEPYEEAITSSYGDLEKKILLEFQLGFYAENPDQPNDELEVEELKEILQKHKAECDDIYINPLWDNETCALLLKRDLSFPEGLNKEVKTKIYDDLSWTLDLDNRIPAIDEQMHALNSHETQRNSADGICRMFNQAFCESAYENLIGSLHYMNRELRDFGISIACFNYMTTTYEDGTYNKQLAFTSQTEIAALPMNLEPLVNPESRLEIAYKDQMIFRNNAPSSAINNTREIMCKLYYYLYMVVRSNHRLVIFDKCFRHQQIDTTNKIVNIYHKVYADERHEELNQQIIVCDNFTGPHQLITCNYSRNKKDAFIKTSVNRQDQM